MTVIIKRYENSIVSGGKLGHRMVNNNNNNNSNIVYFTLGELISNYLHDGVGRESLRNTYYCGAKCVGFL